jgi:hypothetical protein
MGCLIRIPDGGAYFWSTYACHLRLVTGPLPKIEMAESYPVPTEVPSLAFRLGPILHGLNLGAHRRPAHLAVPCFRVTGEMSLNQACLASLPRLLERFFFQSARYRHDVTRIGSLTREMNASRKMVERATKMDGHHRLPSHRDVAQSLAVFETRTFAGSTGRI